MHTHTCPVSVATQLRQAALQHHDCGVNRRGDGTFSPFDRVEGACGHRVFVPVADFLDAPAPRPLDLDAQLDDELLRGDVPDDDGPMYMYIYVYVYMYVYLYYIDIYIYMYIYIYIYIYI